MQLFTDASGTSSITSDEIGKATACFERTHISNNSPYDKYARGDASALSFAQQHGMQASQDNGCSNCHSGPMLPGYQLHVLSAPGNSKPHGDAGANGNNAFRTTILRKLALTAPYMHSSVFNSLDDVPDFYDFISDVIRRIRMCATINSMANFRK